MWRAIIFTSCKHEKLSFYVLWVPKLNPSLKSHRARVWSSELSLCLCKLSQCEIAETLIFYACPLRFVFFRIFKSMDPVIQCFGSGSGSGGSGTFWVEAEADAEAIFENWVKAEAEAILTKKWKRKRKQILKKFGWKRKQFFFHCGSGSRSFLILSGG